METSFPSSDISSSCGSTTFEGAAPWSFHNLIEIEMKDDEDVKPIVPFNELRGLQKLEKIYLDDCYCLEEVFEALEWTKNGINESQNVVKIPNLREVNLYRVGDLKYIFKSNQWTVLEFPNLTRVSINWCFSLQYVFTCSMLGSLLQLQELHISDCYKIEAIVKEEEEEEEGEGKVNEFELPSLKSLKLVELRSLKGFCLGKEAFSCPSLDTLEIKNCPEITTFTNGRCFTVGDETIVKTNFGVFPVKEEDINSFIKTKRQEGFQFQEPEEEDAISYFLSNRAKEKN